MNYKYETITYKPIENINGQQMIMTVNKFQCGYEMNISTNWWLSLKANFFLLFLLSSFCFIDYVLQIYNTYHILGSFVLFVILLVQFTRILKSENLLVVKNVGIQIEESYLFGSKRSFIPWNLIESVFINEVIKMHKVLFILTVKTWEEEERSFKLFPLFKISKPRLKDAKDIYRLLKCL